MRTDILLISLPSVYFHPRFPVRRIIYKIQTTPTWHDEYETVVVKALQGLWSSPNNQKLAVNTLQDETDPSTLSQDEDAKGGSLSRKESRQSEWGTVTSVTSAVADPSYSEAKAVPSNLIYQDYPYVLFKPSPPISNSNHRGSIDDSTDLLTSSIHGALASANNNPISSTKIAVINLVCQRCQTLLGKSLIHGWVKSEEWMVLWSEIWCKGCQKVMEGNEGKIKKDVEMDATKVEGMAEEELVMTVKGKVKMGDLDEAGYSKSTSVEYDFAVQADAIRAPVAVSASALDDAVAVPEKDVMEEDDLDLGFECVNRVELGFTKRDVRGWKNDERKMLGMYLDILRNTLPAKALAASSSRASSTSVHQAFKSKGNNVATTASKGDSGQGSNSNSNQSLQLRFQRHRVCYSGGMKPNKIGGDVECSLCKRYQGFGSVIINEISESFGVEETGEDKLAVMKDGKKRGGVQKLDPPVYMNLAESSTTEVDGVIMDADGVIEPDSKGWYGRWRDIGLEMVCESCYSKYSKYRTTLCICFPFHFVSLYVNIVAVLLTSVQMSSLGWMSQGLSSPQPLLA
jgi:hypothetical protein